MSERAKTAIKTKSGKVYRQTQNHMTIRISDTSMDRLEYLAKENGISRTQMAQLLILRGLGYDV